MSSTDLEVLQSPADVMAALKGGKLPEIEDPAAVNQRIMESILDADNVDDVFADDTLCSTEAIAGRPIKVRALRVLRSRFKDRVPVFMVLDATTLDSDHDLKITTSSSKVMAKLAKLYELDALPIDVVIRASDQETASGHTFYDLERYTAETA